MIAFEAPGVVLHHGDCIEVMRSLPDSSVHAVVTDPPYGLEFMGKDWDAPWEQSDVNADAGFSSVELADGRSRLPRPSFTGSTNPKCLTCKGTRRGRRDGTAKVAVCLCPDGGTFPNVRAVEMRAFQEWCEQWAREAFRVLKPGGHMLAFGGSRTWHRLTAGIEDAGFEIRDSIAWLYGSGFPKSLDVSKAIDATIVHGGSHSTHIRATNESRPGEGRMGSGMPNNGIMSDAKSEARVTRSESQTPEGAEWSGWGTALKPAFEPIVVARKPLVGTVAKNVLEHGTGALNIDASRTAGEVPQVTQGLDRNPSSFGSRTVATVSQPHDAGRWPTNVVLDESQAAELDKQSGVLTSGANPTRRGPDGNRTAFSAFGGQEIANPARGADSGGASRFFPTFRYEAKAPTDQRPNVDGVQHPTVKPLDLMRWLVRLVTPKDGTILEPFAGSGTTLEAALIEGFNVIGIEREATYLPLIEARITKPLQVSMFGDWEEAL